MRLLTKSSRHSLRRATTGTGWPGVAPGACRRASFASLSPCPFERCDALWNSTPVNTLPQCRFQNCEAFDAEKFCTHGCRKVTTPQVCHAEESDTHPQRLSVLTDENAVQPGGEGVERKLRGRRRLSRGALSGRAEHLQTNSDEHYVYRGAHDLVGRVGARDGAEGDAWNRTDQEAGQQLPIHVAEEQVPYAGQ